MLPEFGFWRSRTLAEALALLAEHGERALPMAGGTNVIPDLRGGRQRPAALVDISRLAELRGIRQVDGQVVLGAGTTIGELLDSLVIAQAAPALAQAAAVFANPLVRNRATVGGNLADASPAADMAPPLLALDAQVELAGARGVRCLPLADFLTGVRQTLRQPDELLVAIRWAAPAAPRAAGGFYKVGLRKSDAISVLSVAVTLAFDAAGLCCAAAIALGAVAPRPLRVYPAEAILAGQALTPAHLAEAARLAGAAARPISDIRGSAAYRRQVTEVVTRRLLAQAVAAACPASDAALRTGGRA